MNENENSSCALPLQKNYWQTILWSKVILKVNRLQRRIAKAVKEKHWGKAKALIHLLSKSFYAKLLAVFRVTTNMGGNTPGVDNIVWKQPNDKLKKLFRENRGIPAHAFIRILNPVIRGWANYHKGVCSKRTFAKMGTFIYWQLKRWAKYQHGNKNRWWIFHRYFHDNHFTDQRITPKGIQKYRLYRIAYVSIQYHVKVKAKANPFLKEYDKYFYQRTKWREDLAKECKQITTFISSKTSNISRVELHKDSLKSA